MLRKRADLSFKRLNRSIYFETISTFIALVLIVIYFYQLSDLFFIKWAGILIIALIVIYLGLIGWLYQKLNSIEIVSDDIKKAMGRKVSILKRFVNLYFWINMLVAPIVFPIAVFAGYLSGSEDAHLMVENLRLTDPRFLVQVAISFILILLFYPFLKWYINKLYGRHVKDLEECLEGLEEGD